MFNGGGKLSSEVKNFLSACIHSSLSLLPQLEMSEVKTHHREVVHEVHPSVLTAGSTSQLFLGAFFSLKEMKSKFLFSGTVVG